MKKALAPVIAALVVLAVVVGVIACGEEDVGIPCQMTNTGSGGETPTGAQINPQAMDCRSRLCLFYGGVQESRALCTQICEDSGDCPDETETCKEGFTCIYATQTTQVGCCKMCVCKRYVVGSDAGAGVSQYCESHPNPDCPKL